MRPDEKTVTVLPLTLYLLSFHHARVFVESLKCKLESKLERVLINSHLVKKLIPKSFVVGATKLTITSLVQYVRT